MKILNIITILLLLIDAVCAQGWTKLASLPNTAVGRHHPITFAIGDFGYMGLGNSPDSLLDDFYKYDPNTNIWTSLKKFPGGVRGISIGLDYGGKGYLGFGVNKTDALAELWEYNPLNDEWTKKTNCPCDPRTHPAFVALNDKIYAGLGGSSNGNLKDWWEYDIQTNQWTKKADFPGPKRHHPYQFAIDPYVYVGMGHGEGIYNDLYRYDPKTDVWTDMENLPDQGRVAGTQFELNGRGYVLSGQGQTHDFMESGEFWEYEPIKNEWKQLDPHPDGESRWAPGSFVLKNKVYFMGGENRGDHFKDLYRYEFNTTSNKNIAQEQKVILNSNSNTGLLTIEFNLGSNQSATLHVSDLFGKDLYQKTLSDTRNIHQVNISTWPEGTYLVSVTDSKGQTVTNKFSKN